MEENKSRIKDQINASYPMEEIKELQSDNESQIGARRIRVSSKMVNDNEGSTVLSQIKKNINIHIIGES
jgi:hypothetical protein